MPGSIRKFHAAAARVHPADCQSAIQQVANLRYTSNLIAASEFGLKEPVHLAALVTRIEAFCAVRRLDVAATTGRRVVKQLVANGAIVKEGKCYRKA